MNDSPNCSAKPASRGVIAAATAMVVCLCFPFHAVSSGDVPFGDGLANTTSNAPRKFTTTSGETVVELMPADLLLEKTNWPDFAPPHEINSYFQSPFRVWRAEGGYFGTFVGGQLGGGFGGDLFFATNGTRKWLRILDRPIFTMARIGERTYVAAGGFAHSGFPTGWVYIVSQNMQGEWSAKQIFSTSRDIPKIFGETRTKTVLGDSELLVVFRMNPVILQAHSAPEAVDFAPGDERSPDDILFGINSAGVVSFLGKIK